MKIYTVNKKSHIKHLRILILLLLVFPYGAYLLAMYKSNGNSQVSIILVGVTIFIFLIPHLLLHYNHFIKSKGSILQYDQLNGIITYSKGNFKVCFKKEDVAKIIVFKSWSLSQGKTPALSWDVYNFSRIELKDGTLLKISSLLVSELDKILKLKNTHIEKTLFAWIT